MHPYESSICFRSKSVPDPRARNRSVSFPHWSNLPRSKYRRQNFIIDNPSMIQQQGFHPEDLLEDGMQFRPTNCTYAHGGMARNLFRGVTNAGPSGSRATKRGFVVWDKRQAWSVNVGPSESRPSLLNISSKRTRPVAPGVGLQISHQDLASQESSIICTHIHIYISLTQFSQRRSSVIEMRAFSTRKLWRNSNHHSRSLPPECPCTYGCCFTVSFWIDSVQWEI